MLLRELICEKMTLEPLPVTGLVSLILCVRWAEDLEACCEQYEEALRKHGIEMD